MTLPVYPGRRAELAWRGAEANGQKDGCVGLWSLPLLTTERECAHRFSKVVSAVTGKTLEVSA